MMHILVLLLSLLVFRLYCHHPVMDRIAALRPAHWFEGVLTKLLFVIDKIQAKAHLPWFAVALLLLLPVPLAGAFLVKLLSHLGWLSFIGTIASGVVLVLCLESSDEEDSLPTVLWATQQQLLMPLLGFAVAGPFGSLLVVCTRLLANSQQASALISNGCHNLLHLLEWLPARLSILLYGLQEDIQAVSKLLMSASTWTSLKSEAALKEGVSLAFRNENQQTKPRILVNRLLILWSAAIVLGLLIF